MARNHVLLLGLFLKLVFLIHSSEQFEDPLQQHILSNEDGNHELSALEFQKILFEYDKDGDGELSGQEMSKYIEDTLATLKPETGGRDSKEKLQKGSVGYRGSKQKSSKTAQTWSVKQIVGGLVVVFFVTAVCVALLQRRDQTSSQTAVEVADVRAARLRKLAGEKSDTKTENSPPACVKETSALNRQPSIDSNKKGLRKRVENSEVTATNTGEGRVPGTNKQRDGLRLLSSNAVSSEPSSPNTGRSLSSIEVEPSVVRALTSEHSPVPITGCSQEATADRFQVKDITEVKKEISTSLSKRLTAPKQEKIQDLPYHDVAKKVLMQVLECSFVSGLASMQKSV
ncbi:uncharacterized protein LOC113685414, partial [Pocillopora damicornis]|uniref:uncharacterized protein LOC113685414 n=1 Tax=Pocillopora damicornis TaxID=46731 RepID=UPI000F554556